jgi:8-amino-3,8-dideoxy-alpha-D-manno-octulosonate transaminase
MKRREFIAGGAAAAGLRAQTATRPRKPRLWGPLYYDEAERVQLNDVLESRNPFRWYAADSKVLAFEQAFAKRMGVKYALAVTSGTGALQTAVAALGIGPGDEVILPAWTWHSCFAAIVHAGALPVFAEIDETFNIDSDDIERHITPQTKVIMAVHLQGTPCRIDRVLEIARKHKIRVLEDSAQSVGGSFQGKPLGSMGDIGIYSLQQNKTITAGEGGAVVTNDPVLFERASRFHDIGVLRNPHKDVVGTPVLQPFVGTNFRMNEFSGGVLLAQIRKIDRIIRDARTHSTKIYDAVRSLDGIRLRTLPDPAGDIGAFPSFGFSTKVQRDAFVAAMRADGLPANPPGGSVVLPLEPYVMEKQTVHPAWPSFNTPRGKSIAYGPESCRRTVDILDRFAGIPIDPKWTASEVDTIIEGIRRHWAAARKQG